MAILKTATGALRSILYGKEATDTFGAGIVANKGILLRNTGDSLNLAKTTTQTAELSGDRAIRFMKYGNESVAGDISFELAHTDFNDLIEAVMCNTWDGTTTKTLKQGDKFTTFGFEKGFEDIKQYIHYKGCMINTLAISMATDAIVTGTVGIVGAGAGTFTNTSIGKDSDAGNPTNSEPFVSFDGAIKIDGTDACAAITGLDFTIDNGITANYSLCSPEAVSMTADRFNVTGTLTMLFADAAELNKFTGDTEVSSSLEITLTSGTDMLMFSFPKIIYTGGDVSVSGGGVVPISLPFQALYDGVSGAGTALTITTGPKPETP